MNERDSEIELYVLDALSDDIEDLESILRMLNSNTTIGWHRQWGRRFYGDEVKRALKRLIDADQVKTLIFDVEEKALRDLGPTDLGPIDFESVWFMILPDGKSRHEAWGLDPE